MHRVFLVEVWLLFSLFTHSSQAKPINCAYLQSKVPNPELTYMLTGQMNVTWQQEKTAAYNYTAHICSTSLMSLSISANPNFCRPFQPINGCFQRSSSSHSNIRQCNTQVFQYSEYSVYLSASYQGCQLRGKIVKIKPRLSIAHPDPVSKLNVYSDQKNVLFIEWTKAKPQEVNFMYSLRCQLINATSKHLCCIRVRLPYGISRYYSEVCKTSQNIQVLAWTIRCGDTHECKKAEVNNLNDFVGRLTTDGSNWPHSPPGVILQVEEKQ